LVDRLLSACLFAFDWDDDGFACSKTMEISNLSLSLSHDYHHAYSLELTNGKEGSKQHSLCSTEEAYYLVEGMMFVSVFPRRFGANGRFGTNDDVIDDVIWSRRAQRT
jgi:hypothetical protein